MSSDNEDTEATGFLANQEKGQQDSGDKMSRRMRIQNDNGEHSLHMVVVIEDIRAALYISFIAIIVLGVVLTKAFTTDDYEAVLVQVYGVTSMCSYFDYAPSTYVLPAIWCFAIIIACVYCAVAMLRIKIAYLEKKLTRTAYILLILAYLYVALSFIYFTTIFAVQPNPAKPVTMVVHTVPYANLKVMFCVFQCAVVYFGIKVSWVGLKLPRWFRVVSVVHIPLLIIVKIFGVFWIINAIGDMGEKNLEGKGLWWSVREDWNKVTGTVIGNAGGLLTGIALPFIQAVFICSKGVSSHALVLAVSDNRVSAYNSS